MHLFIDTNIFLSFYHLTSDDLEELGKLALLLRQKKIRLIVPEQVSTEFRRNRENKIADALKRLRDQKLNLQFPQLCKDYEEYSKLRELQRQYEEHHATLVDRITKDVADRTLKADRTIDELLNLAATVATDQKLLQRARLRCDIGNPPGKNGSLGDAINWETLLVAVPRGESLFFITDDKDYCSPLHDDNFDSFLLEEWSEAKRASLTFYKRLSEFFKQQFPDIKLAAEREKERLIEQLGQSATFADTHRIVAQLRRYTDFTTAQATDILAAALDNTQVGWIINDPDVKELVLSLSAAHHRDLDPSLRQRLANVLEELQATDEEEDHDLPF